MNKSTEPEKSNFKALISTSIAISFYILLLVRSEVFVFGSISGNWVYRYFETTPAFPIWTPVISGILLGLLIFIGSKFIYIREKGTLLFSIVTIISIQILIRTVYPFSLEEIISSDTANSFYSPAIKYSAFEILSKFNELAPNFPLHARTNMPGKILLFEILTILNIHPKFMGYAIITISSLGSLLLYEISKYLFNDRLSAFYALVLYGLIPSKLFFFPLLNTVTPVFILLCLYLLVVYIKGKSILISWLLGMCFYFLILFEPSPLATGIIFAGILGHSSINAKLTGRKIISLLINMSLAFLCTYFIFYLFFSFDLFYIFKYVLNDAVNFNLDQQRPYWHWIGENAKEFFFGIGVPVSMLFIFMTAQTLSQWKLLVKPENWDIDNVFLMSVGLTFLAVTFLGINRGEVTRLWIYLAVFFQVPASRFIAKIPKGEFYFFLVAVTIMAQATFTLQRVQFIGP